MLNKHTVVADVEYAPGVRYLYATGHVHMKYAACTNIYVCVCIRVCGYVYTHTRIYTYVYIYTCIYMSISL